MHTTMNEENSQHESTDPSLLQHHISVSTNYTIIIVQFFFYGLT